MSTFWKWTARIVGGMAALALLALSVLYVLSERIVEREYEVEAHAVAVPEDSASVAEGQRLATIRGCYSGCHGEGTEGEVFFEPPGLQGLLVARLVTPDLGRLAAEWSVVDLERAIRHGVRPNGKGALAMPSSMFQHLSDEDLGKILAFLRSRGPADGPGTAVRLGPLIRLAFVQGDLRPQPETIDHERPHPVSTPVSDPLVHGEYLARTACTECHGLDLEGASGLGAAPPLAVVAGYGPGEFARLMEAGEPTGGRELDLMKRVAVGRFSHLRDDEVSALYAYLRAEADAVGRDAGQEVAGEAAGTGQEATRAGIAEPSASGNRTSGTGS